MHQLEPIRAWSRACNLVIDHYETAKSCEDPVLRNAILNSLLLLPAKLAETANRPQGDDVYAAFAAARACCAQIKTHLYIARELSLIEAFASDKFLVESMDLSRIIEKHANAESPG